MHQAVTGHESGLAAYDSIRIVDGVGVQGTRVNFDGAGTGIYSDNIVIDLSQDSIVSATEASVTFLGATNFGSSDLTVATTRNIIVFNGASVAADTITLRANTNGAATGNFIGIDLAQVAQIVGGATILR